MNKSDLIGELSRVRGITLKQAEIVVNSTFKMMTESLANGGRIEVRGFGSFKVKAYEGFTGRNPKTKEPIEVEPKKLPVFKVGKELHERLNGTHELEEEDAVLSKTYRRWKAQRLEDKIAGDDAGSMEDTDKKVVITWDQIQQIGMEEIKMSECWTKTISWVRLKRLTLGNQ